MKGEVLVFIYRKGGGESIELAGYTKKDESPILSKGVGQS